MMVERSTGFNSTTGLRFSFPTHHAGNHIHHNNTVDSVIQPLFERNNVDEIAELNASRLLIDSLQQRVNVLEKINVDLESRLEKQAIETMDIERQILEAKNKLRIQEAKSNDEREEWSARFLNQEQKSERLRDHLSRTERELYGILQKKYELIRGPVGGGATTGKPTPSRNKSVDGFKKEDSSNLLPNVGSDDFLATLQVHRHLYLR